MKATTWAVGLLALAASHTVALADISGGPVYGGGAYQTYARCMVFNAGPGVATISSHSITYGDGATVALNFDNCGAQLGAFRACVIGAPVVGFATMCKFVTTGGVLRGTISLYDFSDYQLHSSDMR